MSNYNNSLQNEREEYWENLLESMERMRERYNKKASWSLEDCEKVDWLDANIDYYENMIEWCYYRDVEGWTWEDWIYETEQEKLQMERPIDHPMLGHPQQYLVSDSGAMMK